MSMQLYAVAESTLNQSSEYGHSKILINMALFEVQGRGMQAVMQH
jgi:hypothetical protein